MKGRGSTRTDPNTHQQHLKEYDPNYLSKQALKEQASRKLLKAVKYTGNLLSESIEDRKDAPLPLKIARGTINSTIYRPEGTTKTGVITRMGKRGIGGKRIGRGGEGKYPPLPESPPESPPSSDDEDEPVKPAKPAKKFPKVDTSYIQASRITRKGGKRKTRRRKTRRRK